MDAIGALSALGTLSSLIPNLKFVGVYSIPKGAASVSVPTWKFGVASLYSDIAMESSTSGGIDALFASSGLIAPNVSMQVMNGALSCQNRQLNGSDRSWTAAILFNY